MGIHSKTRPIAAAIISLFLATPFAFALLFFHNAQAADTTLTRHALPATEPGLVADSSELTGENWMSGISGSFFLHEINIPGTHDASMWDVYTRGFIAKTQSSYAKTQSMNIENQLKAGVRLFDIRLTQKGPYLEDGPFTVHGPNKWIGDYRFFTKTGKGYLTFETVLTWYAKFLREHPTETVILDVQYESESGDEGKTLAGARQKLDKYYTETNPSTGKPYIYTENGSKAVTTMPQLSDCRGQMVVMSCDNLQYGMKYDSSTGWTPKTIGGVHFAVENHYEAERDLKWKYVEKMLFGGTAVGNETFNDPLAGGTKGASLKLNRSAAGAPLDHGVVASTASNRPPIVTSSPHQDPKEIADYVNPRVYGASGCLANIGTFCGWIMSDFATNDTVKTYWKTNFPSDMQYMTVTYEAPDYTGGLRTTRNVLAGSEITLPSDPFPDSTAKRDFNNNYSFLGWTINGVDYKPGDTVKITDHTRITARVAMNWASFQYRMDAQDNGATFKMDCDVVGSPADIPLHISAGKTLTIDMNGHNIDRASKSYGYSRAFTVDGNLTLTGPGTVKGGYDKNGAGFLVNGTLTTNNVTIEGNRAGRWGGGVYVGSGGTFTMNSGTITKNIAERGGGVFVSQGSGSAPATFAMTGGSVSGNNAKVGGGVSMLYENSAFKVKGNVSITGNYLISNDREIGVDTELATSGDEQNVRLDLRDVITVDGTLDSGARIGVTKVSGTGGGPLKVAYKSDGISSVIQCFKSDQANRQIIEQETYYAAISDGITVRFDTDGGSDAPASQTVGIGGTVSKPADPVKSKCTFEYWYRSDDTSKTAFDFSSTVSENITLKAKWAPVKQTVTFRSNGGSAVEQQSVDYGSRATRPTDPTKEGASFSGWMIRVPLHGRAGQWMFRPYDFSNPVRNNIELHARWTTDTHTIWTTDTHTITFNVDGGSSVAQQTVTYGGVATRPNNPAKDGFTFGGWFTDTKFSNPYNFSTPVKADTTLYAKWIPIHFTVAFESNGGSTVSAQSVASGSAASKPAANPTRTGYVFAGWFVSNAYAGSSYDFGTPVTKDTTLYAQWSTTVTFDSDGGSAVEPQTVAMGAQVQRPENNPTKSGFKFVGWYLGDYAYNFEAPVDAPLTLTAKWEAIPAPPQPEKCIVVFDSNGGSSVPAAFIDKGAAVGKPNDPTKDNSTFEGWYTDPALTNAYDDFSTPVNDDLYLYAKWNVQNHTVTFNKQDGSDPESIQVEHGQSVPAPDEATKDNSLFAGWFKNQDCTVPYNFSSPVVGDLTLYAKWVTMRYDVVFEPNGGSAVAPQSVASGDKAAAPEDPTRTDSTFAGWYANDDFTGSSFDFANTSITADTVLYAKWTATVHFDTDGGSSVGPQTVTCGQQATKPTTDPKKDGNNFEDWFVKDNTTYSTIELAALKNAIATDPSIADYYWIVGNEVRIAYDFDAPVESEMTLYARWSATHTITFDTNGGSAIDPHSGIDDNTTVSAPTSPTKEGYIFDGWYLDTAFEYPFDFSEKIVDDLTLHAKWTELKHTVYFVTDSTDVVPDQTVVHGNKATAPDPAPENDGFDFAGWFSYPELTHPFNFDTPIKNDTILYALWREKQVDTDEYTVTFVDDDPSEDEAIPEAQKVQEDATASKPADPTREHATFDGWYTEGDSELTDEEIAEIESNPELEDTVWVVNKKARVPYNFSKPVEDNLKLYTRWTYKDCLVTYVDEGSELDVDVVKEGDTAKNLEPEEIYGYTFNGWFADETLTQPYNFSKPVTEDLALYAKWTQNRYTVTFNSNGGSEVASQEVGYDEFAEAPADPVWAGHTFMGWYADLGTKFTAQDIAEIEEDEEAYGIEYTDLLWTTDDTTLVKYDFETEPVYADIELVARWEEGVFTYETVIENGAPNIEILNIADAALSVLTDEELTQGAHVRFVVRPLTEQEASSNDAKAIDELAKELSAAHNTKFDISIYKSVEGSAEEIQVHELPTPAQLSVTVPDSLRASGRTYYLLRAHDGEATRLAEGTQDTLTGASDRFSMYGVAANDASAAEASVSKTAQRPSLPKTGDAGIMTVALAILGIGIAFAIISLTGTKTRRHRR